MRGPAPFVHSSVPGGLLVLALLALGCRQEAPPPAVPAAAPIPPPSKAVAPVSVPRFIGSEACGACHPDELARWRVSHHAKAMEPARSGSVLGDFGGARFTQHGVVSTFTRPEGAGGPFVVTTEGADGALSAFDVAYTFGVDPLQQYLVAFPGGRMQATSLAWDARPKREGGQRWFDLVPDERVSPGDPLHWTSAAGQWNTQCAECHSTDLQKGWRADEARYDTRYAEVSVGCEACHGPGSAHDAWARVAPDARPPDATKGIVVALGDGGATWALAPDASIARRSAAPRTSDAELDACGRCHARRETIAEPYAYGRPLLDTHRPALLDAGLYYDDGQIQDEVYEWGSFLQSRMYAAGVSCSDCHEPHDGALRTPGNALCASCHRPEAFDARSHHHHAPGSPAAQCVTCHMPTRLYMRVDARHDHGLRVPRPDLSQTFGTPNACASCHAKGSPNQSSKWAADAIRRWRAAGAPPPRHSFADALHAARTGAPDAESKLVALADDAAQPAIARATAVAELAHWIGPSSLPTLEGAARAESPLLRLAAAEALVALDPPTRVGVGAPLLRDPLLAVRLAAASGLVGVPPGLWTTAQRDDLSRALAELSASYAANADRPTALVNHGALHVQLGEPEKARRAYETSIRLAPYFVPAYLNLADLERGEQDDAAADTLLAQALAIAPESADAHHALGLLRVRQRRLPDAILALGRAADLAPDSARYAYVHAIALHEAGRSDEALRALETALRRRPGERDLWLGIATLARDRGDLPRARSAAQALLALRPEDPDAQALVRQLEGAP